MENVNSIANDETIKSGDKNRDANTKIITTISAC